MEHQLPELPYAKDALAPYISSETLDYHHGKHHNAYVNKLNELIKGTNYENNTLEEIIMNSEGPVFNNAAQIWNHTFFWQCLTPNGSKSPTGQISDHINKTWGSFENFKTEFTKAATTNFGSGWTWLCQNNQGQLEILNTSNADTAMKHGMTPLLVIDVWEHAYYIDYRNVRPDFVNAYWNIVNWDFVNSNLR